MIPKNLTTRITLTTIDLSNTIEKILEKLIKNRLVVYLEQNNLFIKEQTGFRSKKRSIDNLFYIKQKCLESFAKKEKVAGRQSVA